MNLSDLESRVNDWGREQVPFLFLVDFEMTNAHAWRVDEIPSDIFFDINGFTNQSKKSNRPISLVKHPVSFSEYEKKFNLVKNRIVFGDSYLANLTVKTRIDLDVTLEELFLSCKAKYKLCWKNKFVVFSPETFIQIRDGKIYSFPMKGTIDAAVEHAAEIILADEKELSEHVTIVDLIRNDLSSVATSVRVNRFRYVETINTNQKNLLQVSSEIQGDVDPDFKGRLGSLIVTLLPAGSISGAPKKKTAEIIWEAEGETRGFYTGVAGYFDGKNLDSFVMIRFVEQRGKDFFYRSGGGITAQSDVEKEYQEVIDKVYVPLN